MFYIFDRANEGQQVSPVPEHGRCPAGPEMRNSGDPERDSINFHIEKAERTEHRIALFGRHGLRSLEVEEIPANIGLRKLAGMAGVKIGGK